MLLIYEQWELSNLQASLILTSMVEEITSCQMTNVIDTLEKHMSLGISEKSY